MSFRFRTALLDLARLAGNLAWPAALRPAPARAPEIVDLAPHEWRCIAERTLSPHAPGRARVHRCRQSASDWTAG